MSRLTRKINGEWDFSSIEGEHNGGIVCRTCGEIVPLCYQGKGFGVRYGYAYYAYCANCFGGDRETALIVKFS